MKTEECEDCGKTIPCNCIEQVYRDRLKTHDKEIISKIEEMIKESETVMSKKNRNVEFRCGHIKALTELKQFMEGK